MNRAAYQLVIKLFLAICTVAGLELLLRISNYPYIGCQKVLEPDETKMGVFDDDLGWVWQPSKTYSNRGVVYHFDEFGLRAPIAKQGVDFSKPRILFIGDSVTFGYGLNYRQTYAAKIGTLLEDRFSIVNAAVEGYGTDQANLRLQQLIEYIRPSAVVMTYIADHSNRNLNQDRRATSRCLRFIGTKPVSVLIDNELRFRSYPEEIDESREIKIIVAAKLLLERVRHQLAVNSGYDLKISGALLQQIAETKLDGQNIPTFFIYYDNVYSSKQDFNDLLYQQLFISQELHALPVYNWAVDSTTGDYYVFPGEDVFHPNDKLTSYIAEKFAARFGEEVMSVSRATK